MFALLFFLKKRFAFYLLDFQTEFVALNKASSIKEVTSASDIASGKENHSLPFFPHSLLPFTHTHTHTHTPGPPLFRHEASIHTGTLPRVEYTVTLDRASIYYLLCVLGPMAATSQLTLLVFWIPQASGERFSFLVSIYVSSTIYLGFVASVL